jgi:hypothetical protein
MFFVMAMEVLSSLIRLACEGQLLSTFPGISPLQRLSVYADDAVLFVKPLVLDLHTAKSLLQIFGTSSGLHINYSKTTVTMIRGSPQGRALVRNILRFKIDLSLSGTWECSWPFDHLQRQSGNLFLTGSWSLSRRGRGV